MQPLASHLAFLSLTCLPYKMEVVSTTHVHWRQCFTNYGPWTHSTSFTWKFVRNANTDQLILKLRGWSPANYVWPSRWFCCSGLKPLRYGLCVLCWVSPCVLCTKNLINFKNKCLHQHTSHLLPLHCSLQKCSPHFSKPSHSLRIQLKSHLPVKFFPDHNISPLPTSSFYYLDLFCPIL